MPASHRWAQIVTGPTAASAAAAAASEAAALASEGNAATSEGNAAASEAAAAADAALLADRACKVSLSLADAGGGATDSALTVDLLQLDGVTPLAAQREIRIWLDASQYPKSPSPSNNPTWGVPSKGGIVASGNGWATVKTDANGQFAVVVTNAVDETLYLQASDAHSVDALAQGASVYGAVPDSGTWSA